MIDSNQLQDLVGNTVKSQAGDKIGKVVDVYESTSGAEGTFVTVSTGLFGGKNSFVPLAEAILDGEDLVVPYDKDLVKDAPRIDDDEELNPAEEDRLYAHYSLAGPAGATGGVSNVGEVAAAGAGVTDVDRSAGQDASGPSTDDAMTRSEERLHVGTATQETGRARLRKRIVTGTETVTVPVSHEELVVEREPITDGNVGDALRGAELTEEEHEVVLHAERPVVAKETVPVERIRLGTETVTEDATITEDVRKEVIETDTNPKTGA